MLRSFAVWLDVHLVGPSGVIRALVDLLAFAVLLGALLGTVAIQVGVLVAALFGLVGAVLLLIADRRSMRRELTQVRAEEREAARAQAG